MRQGQQNKRSRGRNRKQGNSSSRSFESNGPDVKIRGNAAHVAEKYVALARDALVFGDQIGGENYLQHAEHYFRILSASNAQQQQQSQPSDTSSGVAGPTKKDGAPGEDNTNGAHLAAQHSRNARPDKPVEAEQKANGSQEPEKPGEKSAADSSGDGGAGPDETASRPEKTKTAQPKDGDEPGKEDDSKTVGADAS